MADGPSLQAVIRACLDDADAPHRLSPRQWQVCRHILDCRTPALGGFALDCDGCGERAVPLSRLPRPPLPALPAPGLPGLVRAPAGGGAAGDLPPSGVHPAARPGRLGRGPSQGGLRPAVRDGVGDLARLRRRSQAPGRAAGHDRGAAYLGPDVDAPCPSALPGARRGARSRTGDWHPAKSTYLFPVRALSRHVRGGFVSRLRRAFEAGQLPRLSDRRKSTGCSTA